MRFSLPFSVFGQMERVLKDDAVEEKGERARMVRQRSLIRSIYLLVSFGWFGGALSSPGGVMRSMASTKSET